MSEFVFYIYDYDEDDPRFSFWVETKDDGMSLYERPPDGQGMWLKPSKGSDHDSVEPSDELETVVAQLLESGVEAERVKELSPHERYFVQSIHGTIEKNPDAVPGPVYDWMQECAELENKNND